ncbi:MAG: hypothetical protein KDA91_01245 [Planctomycetaceae bacterium]|nr:hypothetical protein [Planctomycetaceae bacterium]
MNPQLKYKQAQSFSWTRIDMLLLIYEKAVHHLTDGVHLIEKGDTKSLILKRLSVQRVVLMIMEGIDPQFEESEIPRQILRICRYVIERTESDSLDDWRSALNVIQTIREGFQAVQDDARAAEYSGLVPALDVVSR